MRSKITITLCLLLFTCLFTPIFSQKKTKPANPITSVNTENITIVRDKWGVPYIYAPTDREVAYGFAWAAAEDDFQSIQENLLAVRERLGEVKGKEGVILDFLSHLIAAKEIVDTTYEKQLSPQFRQLLETFVQGINDYAAAHPEEILLDGLFPVSAKDQIQGYMLQLTLMTNVQFEFERIFTGNIQKYLPQSQGSNGIAISRNRTTDGKTYLAANSHQPLEGPFSWYEAHLESEEGWKMHGAGFPGSPTLFIGANENLGWTHTVSYPDLADVYLLDMNPHFFKKLEYQFDGKWERLQVRRKWAWVKVWGFLKVPVRQIFYWSKYGPVIRNEGKYYALRFPTLFDIRAAEQWYRMNKAQNFEEFQTALAMHAHPGLNLVYADRADNIYYLSNGQFPYRDPQYNWRNVLPGDTSATLWAANDYFPLDSLPQVLNPDCGYLFDTNNSPFDSTCPANNLQGSTINPTMGFTNNANNRSNRFQELIEQYDSLSYADFKRIKYDRAWAAKLSMYIALNLEDVLHLDAAKHPDIAESIQVLKSWDRTTEVDNESAALFSLIIKYMFKQFQEDDRLLQANVLTEAEMVALVTKAQKHLVEHFGKVQIPLGDLQFHVRGDVALPVGGTPDVLAAMFTNEWEGGKFRSFVGDSFIQMMRFSENGVEIETCNAFGTSNKVDSPHYTDQMELYVNQQLKPVSMDKATIFKEAKRVYHPGE